MIKAIFFDLDGTIVNTMYLHYKGWKKVLRDYDIIISKKDFFLNEGIKLQKMIELYFKYNNKKINEKIINDLINKKNNYFLENYKLVFYPGIKNLIKFLYNENYFISIVTAGSRIRVMRSLPNNFINYFDKIITGDDCQRGKPFPDPYLKALKYSKFKASQCLVYENAPFGILSAKKAKIKTVAVTNTLDKSFLKDANYIVNSALDFKRLLLKINA